MAKLSAHNSHKVASATKTHDLPSGTTARLVLALRSDGKVLRKTDLLMDGRWSRGSYSVAGSLAPKGGRTSAERFRRYAEQRGYEVA